MATTCPTCKAAIPGEKLNLKEGVGYCDSCQKLWRLIDLAESVELGTVNINEPPGGCRADVWGSRATFTASLRSVGGVLLPLGFGLFWNGIVSIFLLNVIGATWQLVWGPLPAWFPTMSSSNGNQMGNTVGEIIFLWIFLTPFLLIGAGMFAVVLLNAFGGIRVTIDAGEGAVFTGVGSIGYRRRFNANAVHAIRVGKSDVEVNNQHRPEIMIETDRTIRFGTMLREDRRNWLAAALKQALVVTK